MKAYFSLASLHKRHAVATGGVLLAMGMCFFLTQSGCRHPGTKSVEAAAVVAKCNFGVGGYWENYGSDISPNNLAFRHFSEEIGADLASFKMKGLATVRVWLFADGRASFEFRDGELHLAPYHADTRALFQAAKQNGVSVIPVLLDHTLFNLDGDKEFRSPPAPTSFPEWIREPARRRQLILALTEYVQYAQREHGDQIAFWDLVNEPFYGDGLTETIEDFHALWSFLHDLSLALLAIPDTRISIGFRDRATLMRCRARLQKLRRDYVRTTKRDDFAARFVLQFHYYSKHEQERHSNLEGFHAEQLLAFMGLGMAEVCLGEMDPTAMDVFSPERLRDKGFSYVLFWQDESGDWPPLPDIRLAQRPVHLDLTRPPPFEDLGDGPTRTTDLGVPLTASGWDEIGQRFEGRLSDRGTRAAYVLLETKAVSGNVEGKYATLRFRLHDMGLHRPGFYGHLLLADSEGRVWFGPGIKIPSHENDLVLLHTIPRRRAPEIYTSDAFADLSAVREVGLWVVPGHPVTKPLAIRLSLASLNAQDVEPVPATTHGIIQDPVPAAAPKPVIRFSLLQGSEGWSTETYRDTQAMTDILFVPERDGSTAGKTGIVRTSLALQRPDRHRTQGEIQLAFAAAQSLPGTPANETPVLDLQDTLLRARVRAVGPDSGLVAFLKLGLSNDLYSRYEMPGEVKLLLNNGNTEWLQFWIPSDFEDLSDRDVARKAIQMYLKIGLDEEARGRWQGHLDILEAEIVPFAKDAPLQTNLLLNPFLSLQSETWRGDRGIRAISIADGHVNLSLDIDPKSKDRNCGRLVYDIRQNAFLPSLDIRGATLETRLVGAAHGAYEIEMGVEDIHRRFGAFPPKTMGERETAPSIPVSAFRLNVPQGSPPPDLARIAKIVVKISPKHGWDRPLQGPFELRSLVLRQP